MNSQTVSKKGKLLEGFVYVMSNPAMPNLLKLGITDTDPTVRRAKQMSASTSIPAAFVVEYFAQVKNRRKVETRVFKKLKKYRYSMRKEFFTCNIFTAVNAIRSAAGITFLGEKILFTEDGSLKQKEDVQSTPDAGRRLFYRLEEISAEQTLAEKFRQNSLTQNECYPENLSFFCKDDNDTADFFDDEIDYDLEIYIEACEKEKVEEIEKEIEEMKRDGTYVNPWKRFS